MGRPFLCPKASLLNPPVSTLRHRCRDQSGQSAVEFALVLPLLLLVLFGIIEFARAFNAYNDLNQMAAAGARFAAVGRYPGDTSLKSSEADTATSRNATLQVQYFLNGVLQGTCAVGDSVRVTASAPVTIAKVVRQATITLNGKAEMRVERCP
jgi:Flp pilus assembly protein TadG